MIAIVAENMLCYAKNSVAYKQSGVGKIGLTGASQTLTTTRVGIGHPSRGKLDQINR